VHFCTLYLKWKWVIPEGIHTAPTEEINPPPSPFGCPDTLTIIRNKLFSPTPLGDRNFLLGGVWTFSGMTQCGNTLFKSESINHLKFNAVLLQQKKLHY
jgi:hypothetical protein